MKDNSYTATMEVAQWAEIVFGRINEVPNWFGSKGFTGSSKKLNDEFEFNYGEGDSRHYSKQKLIEVIPGKRVVWLVTDSKIGWIENNKEEWTNTKMIFELVADGNKTTVHFTHEGLVPELECYEECEKGWDMIIKEWLCNYIMAPGEGLENKSLTATIEVAQPVSVAFNCISHVANWWSKDFEGSSTNAGDEFVICHTGAHYSKQKLIEVIPNEKIVWLVTKSELDWLEKDKHEWTNTKMIFELGAKDGKTAIHFTHEGLLPELECYARCEHGWNMVIKERLFNYINSVNKE